MIEVTQREDGSYDISWDGTDPLESQLNVWTEEDFLNAIRDKCLELLEVNGGG